MTNKKAWNERMRQVKHIHIIQTVSGIKWILNNVCFFCCLYSSKLINLQYECVTLYAIKTLQIWLLQFIANNHSEFHLNKAS